VEWRRGGLGASDLPAVLGLDPYRSEHDVWEEKAGRRPAFAGNARTRWGHRLERAGLTHWVDSEAGDGDLLVPAPDVLRSDAFPHLWATPDGIAVRTDGSRVGIEVKVTSAWQAPPERVRAQCLAQAGLGGLARVDVVRLSFDSDPEVFRVERDEAAIEGILAAGEAWYVTHVLGGLEPPRRPDEAPADERQALLADDLRRVRAAMAALEARERAIRDDLVASVAGQGTITGQGWRIRVTRTAGAARTGWREVAAAYRGELLARGMADDELDAVEGLHRSVGTPGTRLEAHWDEEG